MPVTIRMPALSPTMTEGKISQWLKKEGDEVKSGDLLAEIETDKATMEFEAVEEGTLGKIIAAAGDDAVAVNTPIAVLLEEGEDDSALADAVESAQSEAKSAPKPEREAKTEEADAEKEQEKTPPPAKAETKAEKTDAPPAPKEKAPAPKSPPKSEAAPRPGARVIASPLARRIARNEGIELGRISGTGPRGRIVKADVEGAIESGAAFGGGGGIFAGHGQSFGPAPSRAEPNTSMRKVIAQRLTESKQTIPHYYVTIDCEIDALLAVRKEVNETDEALRISINDFVIRAVALALKEVPAANASWTEDAIHLYSAADISVAVATEGGLITPIVRGADRKGVAVIAAEVKDLAARAKAGKLKLEEFQGGTFTISNMGMMGVREFAAVINPPQACILAVGAGEERVVVRDGEIGTATLMTCTLSCDHRAVDGAVGAEFLAAFKGLIERPVRLIL